MALNFHGAMWKGFGRNVPLEETVIFLPPGYAPEPAIERWFSAGSDRTGTRDDLIIHL
jgi:hypothetical protein